MSADLIALDWGTTTLRAYRLDEVSRVVAERSLPYGVMHLPAGGFAAALEQACGDWLAHTPDCALLACGMVGSRQGWREAPYLHCPAGINDLAGALAAVDVGGGRLLHLVPGLCIDPPDAVPDVLRGEETQVFGTVGDHESAAIILPGTHSKWVNVREGRVECFATYMTGELYELLRLHSILGKTMEGAQHDAAAFERGVKSGVDGFAADGVLHHLFSVRALGLFDRLAPRAAASYLSGLLVGAEIGGATRGGRAGNGVRLVVLGDPAIADRYMQALEWVGLDAEPGPPAAAAAGLFRLATLAGLLGERRR